MTAEKREIRRTVRAHRRELSPSVAFAAGWSVLRQLAGFRAYQQARSVLTYIPAENEVATTPLVEDSLRRSRLVAVPRMTSTGPVPVRWRPGDPVEIGSGGIALPVNDQPVRLESPAIVFVPLVAWDLDGTRLGRGGGFYDRLLNTLAPDTIRVGLAYELQYIPHLPRDPWDVPMHYIITEQRLLRCGQDVDGAALLGKGGLQLS